MNHLILTTIKTAVIRYPAVIPYLKGRARWVAFSSLEGETGIAKAIYFDDGSMDLLIYSEYKTAEFFESTLTRLVRSVYEGNLGGEFIDIMANLISGQLTQAYEQAWEDEEGDGELPDYLRQSAEDMILNQYDYVDQFYRDIVDARVDEAAIDGLLARVPLWSNRWNEAYNEALRLIAIENGEKLEWQLGATEEHCPECSALNGVVAYAWEWDEIGVKPQSAPNDALTCGGWKCDCSLTVTDKRRTPKAYDRISEIVK